MTPDGLREAVADVCRDVSVSEKTPKVIEPAQPGSAAEFIALYQNHRIADQSYWFSYRHAEYATSVERIRTFNEGQILTAGALGLISVIWPAVSVATGVTIAILGGAVTALSSWAKELRFDELTETYAKAAAELASLEIPEPDDTPAVARWVTHVERVLLPETGTPSEDMIPAGELGRLDERVTALEAGLGGRAERAES
jgi:hypothetical protein